jgi:hypothetical protein
MNPGDIPPLGLANNSSRTCSRLIDRADDGGEILCSKPATVHVVYWWDETPAEGYGFDHGFCCDEHWIDYQRRWTCATHHEIGAACGMPGSLLNFDGVRSWCSADDLPVSEPVRAVATLETSS